MKNNGKNHKNPLKPLPKSQATLLLTYYSLQRSKKPPPISYHPPRIQIPPENSLKYRKLPILSSLLPYSLLGSKLRWCQRLIDRFRAEVGIQEGCSCQEAHSRDSKVSIHFAATGPSTLAFWGMLSGPRWFLIPLLGLINQHFNKIQSLGQIPCDVFCHRTIWPSLGDTFFTSFKSFFIFKARVFT